MLVTLEMVKDRLRVDHDLDNANLSLMIEGASLAVLRYIRKDPDDYPDAPQDGVPADVQNATLYLTGVMYRDPSAVESDKWMQGYLPMPVLSLLYPHRDPAFS